MICTPVVCKRNFRKCGISQKIVPTEIPKHSFLDIVFNVRIVKIKHSKMRFGHAIHYRSFYFLHNIHNMHYNKKAAYAAFNNRSISSSFISNIAIPDWAARRYSQSAPIDPSEFSDLFHPGMKKRKSTYPEAKIGP